jgi:hypothetical protein
MDRKVGDRVLNLYRINELRESLLKRKSELIKPRISRIK